LEYFVRRAHNEGTIEQNDRNLGQSATIERESIPDLPKTAKNFARITSRELLKMNLTFLGAMNTFYFEDKILSVAGENM